MTPAEMRLEIVRLLQLPRKDYARAQALADGMLDGPSADKLALLYDLIAAGTATTTIGLDLISFLDEDDLEALAQKCWSGASVSEAKKDLLRYIVFQRPDLASRDVVADMLEFDHWRREPAQGFAPLHLVFEKGSPSRVFEGRWRTRDLHPTWWLAPLSDDYRFGGAGSSLCPSCTQSTIHLLTIDRTASGLEALDTPIILETCPTCWEPAYYRHHASGAPIRIEPIAVEGVRFANSPIVEARVRFSKTPDRWVHQSWGASNDRQNLCRLGGLPSWVQDVDVPVVPGTNRKMTLLMQLDSNFPTIDGGELLWGSGGCLYVFWDQASRTSCHFAQWT